MNLDIKLHNEDLPDQINLGDNIAVDCEFMGLNVERDKLCLVQISTGKHDAHIIKLNRDTYNAPNFSPQNYPLFKTLPNPFKTP